MAYGRNGEHYLGRVAGDHWLVQRTSEAMRAAAEALTPPPGDKSGIYTALYELWLTTAHERMDLADRNAMLELYATRLAEHPNLIAACVIKKLSTKSKFFPAWAEIETEINALGGERSCLLAVLRSQFLKLKGQNL